MTATPVQILQAARARLEDPAHWTKNVLARNAQGLCESYYAPTATCWCLKGALMAGFERSYTLDEVHVFNQAEAALNLVAPRGYVQYNDDPNTTHKDVLNVLDLAIERLAVE